MNRLVTASFKAFHSLFLPGMFGIFIGSLVITVVSLALFGFGASYLVVRAVPFVVGELGGAEDAGWVKWLLAVGVWFLVWFLFPLVMPLISSFFSASIARIIEEDEYQAVTVENPNSLLAELWHNLMFAVKAIALNILILPLYLLPVANVFIFYGLNGYLLGSEFYFAVASRNLTYAQAKLEKRKDGKMIIFGGVLVVFLATIPVLNLLAPFWGIALMVHLFHSQRQPYSGININV